MMPPEVDPWERRHHKRRMLSDTFMGKCCRSRCPLSQTLKIVVLARRHGSGRCKYGGNRSQHLLPMLRSDCAVHQCEHDKAVASSLPTFSGSLLAAFSGRPLSVVVRLLKPYGSSVVVAHLCCEALLKSVPAGNTSVVESRTPLCETQLLTCRCMGLIKFRVCRLRKRSAAVWGANRHTSVGRAAVCRLCPRWVCFSACPLATEGF
jgi:hypothetical protein